MIRRDMSRSVCKAQKESSMDTQQKQSPSNRHRIENYRTMWAATKRTTAIRPVEWSWIRAALGVVVGLVLAPDATESTDEGMDEEVDEADEADEDDDDELLAEDDDSVAFLEPHWLSCLHWSWPSASSGWSLMQLAKLD